MEFATIKEAQEFFRQEVYQVPEEGEVTGMFEREFKSWVEYNDITIWEIDFPEEGDFSGVNDPRGETR